MGFFKKLFKKEDGEPIKQESSEKIQTYHEGNRFVFKKGDLEKVWGQPEQEVELVDSKEPTEDEKSKSRGYDPERLKRNLEKLTGVPPEVTKDGDLLFKFKKEDTGKPEKPIEIVRKSNVRDHYFGQKEDGTYQLTIYKDDKLHEIWEHPDLEILKTMKEGSCKTFYESGNLKEDISLKNGEYHGLYIYFNENGISEIKGMYKEGLEHGPWVEFYSDGQTRETGTYKEGELDGVWVFYKEDGDIISEEVFKDGEQIK